MNEATKFQPRVPKQAHSSNKVITPPFFPSAWRCHIGMLTKRKELFSRSKICEHDHDQQEEEEEEAREHENVS